MMITKGLIVTALSLGTLGGGSAALQPTALELAAGPVRVTADSAAGVNTQMDNTFDLRVTVVFRGNTRLNIGL